MDEVEYEGVELSVSAAEWPEHLTGLHVLEQNVYVENGKVIIKADPIWKLEE